MTLCVGIQAAVLRGPGNKRPLPADGLGNGRLSLQGWAPGWFMGGWYSGTLSWHADTPKKGLALQRLLERGEVRRVKVTTVPPLNMLPVISKTPLTHSSWKVQGNQGDEMRQDEPPPLDPHSKDVYSPICAQDLEGLGLAGDSVSMRERADSSAHT